MKTSHHASMLHAEDAILPSRSRGVCLRLRVPTDMIRRIILAVFLASIPSFAASDCEIAEWVIRWEGRVTLEGIKQPVNDVAKLPAECHITAVDLTGAVMVPAELAKLGQLDSLRELYLPGPIWNPGGGNEDGNQVFKALAGLRQLEKLYVGWHFNAQINIRDVGISYLMGLTELRDFRCAQCRLANISLAPLKKLRSLDLNYSPFTDKGLEGLAALTELRRLLLRDSMVTDDGLKYLSGLTRLEELDLSGTRVTEKGIESLRNLKGMRKLNLLGLQTTDGGMDILAGMEHLQAVNLYRSRVTNSGVERLRGLKELTDVDLRYSRVTSNGIEALRAALPNAKVQFSGAPSLRSKSAASAAPAADTPRAIAAWVK